MTRNSLIVLGLVACAGNAFAVPFPEVEPNQTRATATPAIGMISGDTITGQTTGTSTTVAGAASADIFRIKTAPRPLGIYRYQLSTSAASGTGVSASIRGLNQTTGAVGTPGVIGTTDSTFATAGGSGTPAAPRISQWYGFGKEEELYYRVTGATSSTAYTGTLSDTTITPIAGGNVVEGNILIARAAGNTNDTDFWVYDSNFNPIATFGQDDVISPATGLTRAFTPGVYYVAISIYNLANNQPSPIDDNFRTGVVLDFPNIVASSSTDTAQNVGLTFTSSNGGAPLTVPATKAAVFDIVFIQFTVTPNLLPSSPSGTASATPSSVNNSGAASTVLAVTVTPGQNPSSTGLAVTADLTNLGGGAAVAMLDNGVAPDATAGDNIFTLAYTVPNTVTTGTQGVAFAISDAQLRTGSASTSVTVTLPPPANDTCTTAITLPAGSSSTAGNNSGATSTGETVSCTTISRGVWYDFTAGPAGTYVFNTLGSGQSDTVLALFDACGGTQIACDDDFFAGGLSQITSTLAAGQNVKVLLGSFGSTATGGAYTLNVIAPVTTSPTGVGSATPSTVINDGTGTTNLRVTVTPGQLPTSNPHGVTVDTSGITGSASSLTLLDDGIAPDAVAGDNIFNGTAAVVSGTALGAVSLPFSITSVDARTGSGNIAVTIREPSGACCVAGVGTIQTASACATAGGTFLGDGSSVVGSGTLFTSADAFPIAIPDSAPATPAVSTITIASATTITSGLNVRLGLAHSFVGDLIATLSDGTTSVVLIGRPGVTTPGTFGFGSDLAGVYNFSDLATQSITGTNAILPPGDYLPTGTGVTPISSFNGSPAAGTWTITISDNAAGDVGRITSFNIEVNPVLCAPTVPPCIADIAGGPTGGPDGIVDGNDFIAFINAFGAGELLADVAGGETGGPDGIVDGNDFIAFINAFGAGC